MADGVGWVRVQCAGGASFSVVVWYACGEGVVGTMTTLSAMSFLTSSVGEDMSGTAAGGKGGWNCWTVAGDTYVLSAADDGAAGVEAGDKTKRRRRASPVNAAKVTTSERVVTFIQ